ncbi:unnamed protein product, partial [Effrenium voratum]
PTMVFVVKPSEGPRGVLAYFSKRWVVVDYAHPVGHVYSFEDRSRLAEEAKAAAGMSNFEVTGSLRASWVEAQSKDPSLTESLRKTPEGYKRAEKEVSLPGGAVSTVPVVPNGVAASSGVTWRKACYLQFHCGVFGAHRSAEKTYALMKRVVWWATMKEDINSWVGKCLTCFKARSRATKVTTKPMKPAADYCWQEVSVDCEGPNKEDYAGNRYSLTYMDCLSHAVYLEPLRALNHAEVRWVPMRGCIKKCRRCLGSLSKMCTDHIDTTPGPHGYTPRDLDRAWSLGVPLEKDLLKSTLEFEPVSDWARKIFGQYKAVSKVVKDHLTSASEARVRLANRYRREVDLKVGDRVVWRAPGLSDPGAKGRVPWKKGQMIKGETKQVEFTMKRRGKQYVLKIGDVMAFRKGYGPKLCAIGRVTSVAVSEGVVHVHKYAPEIGGLRVKWCLLYLDQQGQESLAPEGGRPCIEEVKMSLLITKVELSRDGILQASSARKLDKGGYRLEERPPAQRDPERRGEHEYSEPLDDLVGILKGGRTESGVGVFAAGPSDGFAREQKAVLEYLQNEGVPQHGVDFLEGFRRSAGSEESAEPRLHANAAAASPEADVLTGGEWESVTAAERERLEAELLKFSEEMRYGKQWLAYVDDLTVRRRMVKALRHAPVGEGGWLPVSWLATTYRCSEAEILAAAGPEGSPGKTRFVTADLGGTTCVKALQGHSSATGVSVQELYPRADHEHFTETYGPNNVPDLMLAHGTFGRHVESIRSGVRTLCWLHLWKRSFRAVSLCTAGQKEFALQIKQWILASLVRGAYLREGAKEIFFLGAGASEAPPAKKAGAIEVRPIAPPASTATATASGRGTDPPADWKGLIDKTALLAAAVGSAAVPEEDDESAPPPLPAPAEPPTGYVSLDDEESVEVKESGEAEEQEPIKESVQAGGTGESCGETEGHSAMEDQQVNMFGAPRGGIESPRGPKLWKSLLQAAVGTAANVAEGQRTKKFMTRQRWADQPLTGGAASTIGAVDSALALKVFQTVDKIHTAYNAEKYDNSDSAFFSNYLALLGTMQNQVFFSQKQNEKFVSWIKLAVDGSGKLVHLLDKALETENEKLRLQLSRLERSGEPSRSSTEPRSRAG